MEVISVRCCNGTRLGLGTDAGIAGGLSHVWFLLWLMGEINEKVKQWLILGKCGFKRVSYGQMTRSNSRGNFEDLVIRGGKWNEWRVIIFLSRLGFGGYDCLKFFKTDCWSCYKKLVRKQELNEWRKAKRGNAIVCTISLLPWLQWDRGFNQGLGERERDCSGMHISVYLCFIVWTR